jgi:hypothetical protein
MRAVTGKNGTLAMVTREEAGLYNQAEFDGFLPINRLHERHAHLAEELYKKNVFRKIRKGDQYGYTTHQQKTPL